MTDSARPSAIPIEGEGSEPEQAPPLDAEPVEAPRRFDGLPPVEHLGRALRAASEAADPAVAGRFLILTHRGPDPDAIGACEGLRLLIEKGFAFRCVVATHGKVHRAENVALLRTLDLDLEVYGGVDVTEFCGVLLVDTQPTFRHTVVPEELPVVAVFDHHRSPQAEEPGGGPPHEDVRTGLGATSSILYEYLRDMEVPIDRTTASALFCGVRYDTADLSRNAAPLDEEAYLGLFAIADRQRPATTLEAHVAHQRRNGSSEARTAHRRRRLLRPTAAPEDASATRICVPTLTRRRGANRNPDRVRLEVLKVHRNAFAPTRCNHHHGGQPRRGPAQRLALAWAEAYRRTAARGHARLANLNRARG